MATGELTERQRALLTKARDAIRDDPERYNQLTYGPAPDGNPCGTPRCVAGHIVVGNPELMEELVRELNERAPTEEMRARRIGGAIHSVATKALGVPRYPELFRTEWPGAWRQNDTVVSRGRKTYIERFTPTAQEAVQVIDGILDGRIQGALDQP